MGLTDLESTRCVCATDDLDFVTVEDRLPKDVMLPSDDLIDECLRTVAASNAVQSGRPRR